MIRSGNVKMSPKQYAKVILHETLRIYIEDCIGSDDRREELGQMTEKERAETIRQIDLLVSRALKVIGDKK